MVTTDELLDVMVIRNVGFWIKFAECKGESSRIAVGKVVGRSPGVMFQVEGEELHSSLPIFIHCRRSSSKL